MSILNSQAPDVPELAHQGILQLLRLSVNFCQKMNKYPLPLNLIFYIIMFSKPGPIHTILITNFKVYLSIIINSIIMLEIFDAFYGAKFEEFSKSEIFESLPNWLTLILR